MARGFIMLKLIYSTQYIISSNSLYIKVVVYSVWHIVPVFIPITRNSRLQFIPSIAEMFIHGI